jgi:hypothetical protein
MRFKTVLLHFCVVFAGACSSAVPTGDPGVSAVGEHFLLYEDPKIEIALGIGYAAGHLGEKYLLLGATFAGNNSGRMTRVERAGISVHTPDLQTIPLMSQAEFIEAYGKLNAAARRAEIFSPTVLDSRPTRRPCGDWFFRAPSDGLTRDVLTISSIEVCDGILFFLVPGGVQSGKWMIEVELEEIVVEIPFALD